MNVIGGVILSAVVGGLGGALGALLGMIASRNLPVAARSRRQQIFTAVGVIPGVIAAQVLASSTLGDRIELALGTKSRVEVFMLRALGPVMESPKFRDALKGKSEAEAHAIGASLAGQGVPHLSAEDLDVWARTRLRLASTSPVLCAQFWKGGGTTDALGAALNALNDAELEQWAGVSARAVTLALEGRPKPQVAQEVGERALLTIAGRLPPNEVQTLQNDLANPALDDARACQVHQTVMSNAQKLQSPLRTDFYRLMASQMN